MKIFSNHILGKRLVKDWYSGYINNAQNTKIRKASSIKEGSQNKKDKKESK